MKTSKKDNATNKLTGEKGFAPGRRRQIVSVLIALAVLVGAWLFLFQSEEDRVRSVLSTVLSKLQVSATSNPLLRLKEIRDLATYFTDDIELQTGDGEDGEEEQRVIKTKKELLEKALAAKSAFSTLEVLMLPSRVKISGNTAEAEAEIHVLGSLPNVEGRFYERRLAHIGLKKSDGRWLISKVSTINLRKPEEKAIN